MTILLAAVNSRFSHTCLAVRSIAAYVQKYLPAYDKLADKSQNDTPCIFFHEWTISEPILQVLSQIISLKPDAVLFSVYIWNTTQIMSIIPELRKICPDILIGAGGPEVSYQAEKIFQTTPSLDFIMRGEGEQTVLDITQRLCNIETSTSSIRTSTTGTPASILRHSFLQQANSIPGVYSKRDTSVQAADHETHCENQLMENIQPNIVYGGERALINNIGKIPFPYKDNNGNLVDTIQPESRIIYYESSRGCPFHCSYCLSSIDKTVRFRPLDMVLSEIQFFMDNNCSLVKFVDRTFNLNEDRYIAIWRYIIGHHNGKTVFHFEIAAQQLSNKALDLIQQAPIGAMQFEIGIQSIHPKTLKEVGRPADITEISRIIKRIPPTIHIHLDLIAGLPHESLCEFAESFNYTISLLPSMIQLGFLKVLSGTTMANYAESHDFTTLSLPPYEVLQTPDFSYKDLQTVKQIETTVDWYYNTGDFLFTFKYIIQKLSLEKTLTPFNFFHTLSIYLMEQNLLETPHKTDDYFSFLASFFDTKASSPFLSVLNPRNFPTGSSFSTCSVIKELLRFDFIRRSKPGSFPTWYERRYSKEKHIQALENFGARKHFSSARESFALTSYEEFFFNPDTETFSNISILFFYKRRDLQKHHKTDLQNSEFIIDTL